jgi:hypothetical protein
MPIASQTRIKKKIILTVFYTIEVKANPITGRGGP